MVKRHSEYVTKEELFKIATSYPMNFSPGEQWAYCDAGYQLLGFILEEISGMSYSDFLQHRIFDPLQMHDTQVNDINTVLKGRSEGYSWSNGVLSNARHWDMSWTWAAGSLISNVVDLAKWDRALYGNNILSKASLQEMWTPVTLNDGSAYPYGFAWDIQNVNGHSRVFHTGGIAGFNSCVYRLPNDGFTTIALLNEEAMYDPDPVMPAFLMASSITGLCEPSLAATAKRAIRDHSPKVTQLAKNFLFQVMEGRPDKKLCSESYWGQSSWELPQYRGLLQHVLPCNSITLVDRQMSRGKTIDQYQLAFSSTTFLFRVAMSSDHKIAEMSLVGEVTDPLIR